VTQPYVLQLALQRTQWLSSRDELIASNIANANTPGFQATDLQPFSAILDNAQVSMVSTNPSHMTPGNDAFAEARVVESDGPETTLSGNSVDVENEMMKLGEVNRDYTMATNVKRVIHQMIMSALK
jgi:flagellar basal-body rod protein FlgB